MKTKKTLGGVIAIVAMTMMPGCVPGDMSVDYGTSIGPGYISVGTSFPVGTFGPYYDGPLWGGGPLLWPAEPAPRPVSVRPPVRPNPIVPSRPLPVSPEPGPVIPSGPSINPGGGGNGGGGGAPRPGGNQFRPGGNR